MRRRERGAYAHVRRRSITGPGSSKNSWSLDTFNRLTVAYPDQTKGCNTDKDGDASTSKGAV